MPKPEPTAPTRANSPEPGLPEAESPKEDLSVTALYTSAVWHWGELPAAELYETRDARIVFRVTNVVLGLVRLFRWGLTSLKHSLLHRHVIIDKVVERAKPTWVLEVAAGLSRRGAAISANPDVTYVEVDLPHVVARKKALLERTDAGRAVAERTNFTLIAADVAELDLGAHVAPDGPSVIIAEGLCMYLQPDEQRQLWRRVAEALHRGGTFVFDLVPWVEQPKPGLLGRALDWLMRRFTGGKSFEKDQRTRDDLARDLREVGFAEVELLDPNEMAREWALPYADKRTQQLVFVCRRQPEATVGQGRSGVRLGQNGSPSETHD